jgi:hypothetical protein
MALPDLHIQQVNFELLWWHYKWPELQQQVQLKQSGWQAKLHSVHL